MSRINTVEMLAFSLKMMGRKSRKSVLISAGKPADKERLLPTIMKLAEWGIIIYSTKGTSRFLLNRGVVNQEIFKIAELKEPNIHSFLSEDRFDLVINIVTGNHDYDEASDNNLIRTLAIKNGIPLITDVDVAVLTIDELAKRIAAKPGDDADQPWNLHREFLRNVADLGGYACYHAHFDKAYLISSGNLKLSQVDMQKKWALYKYLKENYTHADLIARISRAVEAMIAQGVTLCRTLVDADSTVKLLPIRAALEVKEKFKHRIRLEVGVQPLQGVLDEESRKYFAKACELADVVGGLPSKDRPTPERHLDIIMSIAKDLNKPLDVHVDQENNPQENETELLAVKTIQHHLEGRVSAVHAISLAAKPVYEQDRIMGRLKDANITVIVCPSAALSMKQLSMDSVLHNSIAPVPRLLDKGITVRLGVDNISDLFMPLVDGDMWFECRLLMEACRFYDLRRTAEIACDHSGELPPMHAKISSEGERRNVPSASC